MKKILFIISDMETGGVSKSMTSLMNVIDRNRYDVALMIISPKGPFMKLLPGDLRLITNPTWAHLSERLGGAWHLLKSGHPILAAGNTLRLVVSLFSKSASGRMIAAMMPDIKENFDVAIDFNGQQQLYYMVNKIKASKKITFFHSDYAKWPYYYSADKIYFPKVDNIFTISSLCADSLKRYFPEVADKINIMENISSRDLISRMSMGGACEIRSNGYSLVTIGHVCENKGIYLAIEAASILNNKGVDFHWYFIGSIDNETEYSSLCKKNGIAERMHFMGIQINPYPYIKKATIVVHPSKFEGRSIALDEAKILCKPIVVTNFSTVADQFTNRVNATICQMNPQSIADAIEELLIDNSLQEKYTQKLLSERHDNISEIEKLYKIFDD